MRPCLKIEGLGIQLSDRALGLISITAKKQKTSFLGFCFVLFFLSWEFLVLAIACIPIINKTYLSLIYSALKLLE